MVYHMHSITVNNRLKTISAHSNPRQNSVSSYKTEIKNKTFVYELKRVSFAKQIYLHCTSQYVISRSSYERVAIHIYRIHLNSIWSTPL